MHPKRPVILIIGTSGQVGWELLRTMAPLGTVVGADLLPAAGCLEVDLSRPETLAPLVKEVRPSIIINAAAYTAVDRAEQELELVTAINAIAVGELGRLTANAGIPIVHYSTDFVFSGTENRPYREDDPTGPVNVYGDTKLAGEQALIASGANYLLLRTSWMYGVRGQNFLLTMRKLFRERDEVRVVDDQTGSPTWSRLLAEVTAQIIGRTLYGGLDFTSIQGVYHISGGDSVTWYGFAKAIHEHAGSKCRLIPISSSEYRATAKRPAYSVLDNSKLQQTFGLVLPHWRDLLGLCLADSC